MWKWILLGLGGYLAWRWYQAGFIQIQNSGDTFNVKVRKIAGALGVLNPISKKDNYNFGVVNAPSANVDSTKEYWRTLNGSLNRLLPSSPANPNTPASPDSGFGFTGGLKRL